MSEWHYTSAGQQLGPVSTVQLKEAARAGQITPQDLVWREGMAEWVPASKLKGLFDGAAPAASGASSAVPRHQNAPQAAAPGDSAASSTIGYYNPTAGPGERLAANLKGFPVPTGSQDEWPLSTAQLAQLAQAEANRKNIRNLASAFLLLFVLGVLVSVVLVILLLFATSFGGGRSIAREQTAMVVAAGILIALTVLYYFAARETRRCRTWPAIVFAVLFGLAILLNFISAFMTAGAVSGPAGNGGAMGVAVMTAVLSSIIPFALLWMCVQAITSIPKFLASPVWAQEALVASKL